MANPTYANPITTATQAQADAAGVSLADYNALLAKYPPVYQANSQGGSYGFSAGGQNVENPQMTSALQTLALIKQYGGTSAAAATPAATTGSGTMTWDDVTNAGYPSGDIAAFQAKGWTPDQVMQSIQSGIAAPPSSATASDQSNQNAFGISQAADFGSYKIFKNAQGQQLAQDNAGNYFNIDSATGNHQPVTDAQAVAMGFQTANPETAALNQLKAIDPNSEALRTALSGSYLDSVKQGSKPPTTAKLQSYLDAYKNIDPAGYAQRVAQTQQVTDYVTKVTGQAPASPADALAQYQKLDPQGYASMQALNTSQDASLKQATDQLNLGSQLDPVTARQVEQQTRLGQASRGNVYGTPQMVEEAMTTGQAGLALQQQRQAAAQAAQGSMQSYLTSGATTGALGENLYHQGLTDTQNALGTQQSWLSSGQDIGSLSNTLYQQGLQNQANSQATALSYLNSGQTPYQAGNSYVTNANNAAATAAVGGPVYNPTALGTSYTGTAAQAPQYGLDLSNQTTNWYNSLSATSGGATAPTKNQGVSAATGALSGAASGAMAGSAAGPYGTLIGAGVGAVAGGVSGYYS